MGRLKQAAVRLGVNLPASGLRTPAEDRDRLMDACRSADANERQLALRNLCTCHVQADDDEVWTTLLSLLDDPSAKVRTEAVHAITDSTPSTKVAAAVAALEARRNDSDERLRRRIRKTLAHYHRTGKLTDAPR